MKVRISWWCFEKIDAPYDQRIVDDIGEEVALETVFEVDSIKEAVCKIKKYYPTSKLRTIAEEFRL